MNERASVDQAYMDICRKNYSRKRNGMNVILKCEKITKTNGIFSYLRM